MRVLVKGAGDLATGVAASFFRKGHQVVMTEIAIPLTVRRQVAFSRAVYERKATVEGIEAVLVETEKQLNDVLENKKIAVIVDPEAKIKDLYQPDVLIDAILAKRNTGTKIDDAPCVIGLGSGFFGGRDCYVALETMRGESLGRVFYDGTPLANTGVPGLIGGYGIERLLKASGDGMMKPVVKIGTIVEKGQVVAYTGGKAVYAKVDGVVRGMLQEGVSVKEGLKIGDVDPRKDSSLVYKISDKANLLGEKACEVAEQFFYGDIGIVVLAAGRSSRYGANKLLDNVEGAPMIQHIFDELKCFTMCTKVVSTRFSEIEGAATDRGIAVAINEYPERGIAYSLQCGLKKCLELHPDVKGILFVVGDQPYLKAETLRRLMKLFRDNAGKIVCAGANDVPGNPVLWDKRYFDELLQLKGDTGGRQILKKYPKEIMICETDKKELQDIDRKKGD